LSEQAISQFEHLLRFEMAAKADETVKVVVRIRPMSGEEERNGNLM
jgi:hypothetical protein